MERSVLQNEVWVAISIAEINQKVSNAIFLVAPVNYDIASNLAREELKNKVSVSWLKNN